MAPKPEAIAVSAAQSAVKSPRTLRVAAVTGGETTRAIGETRLGNEEFHQALITSLNSSGAFQQIVSAGDADWELRTVIVSQQMRGALRNTEDLMVRYEISDLGAMQPVWAQTVYSRHELSVSDVFVGVERHQALLEVTAKENIADFLRRLEAWLGAGPA